MVEIKNISIKYNSKTVIDTLSCSFFPYKINILIGESGAGKTTLLKAVAGIISAQEGQITIQNKNLNQTSAKDRSGLIGYVFQDYNLFLNMTALENCIDPLIVRGTSPEDAHAIAKIQLQKLGMWDYKNSYPAELSGGQQQRVAIARSLCLSPQVLILDEPSASLDPNNTATLIAILKKLSASGLTIILSSQDMFFVRKIFDQVYYMDKGEIVEFSDDANLLEKMPRIKSFID